MVDMGAYEVQGNPFPVKFGDLTGDGFVFIEDLFALFAAYGVCVDSCCLADMDLDGIVGITDLFTLFANWGFS